MTPERRRALRPELPDIGMACRADGDRFDKLIARLQGGSGAAGGAPDVAGELLSWPGGADDRQPAVGAQPQEREADWTRIPEVAPRRRRGSQVAVFFAGAAVAGAMLWAGAALRGGSGGDGDAPAAVLEPTPVEPEPRVAAAAAVPVPVPLVLSPASAREQTDLDLEAAPKPVNVPDPKPTGTGVRERAPRRNSIVGSQPATVETKALVEPAAVDAVAETSASAPVAAPIPSDSATGDGADDAAIGGDPTLEELLDQGARDLEQPAAAPKAPPERREVTRDEVAAAMTRARPRLVSCAIRNAAHGTITVRFTIEPSGAVSQSQVVGRLDGTDFAGCAERVIEAIRFEAYQGRPATFSYPVSLND